MLAKVKYAQVEGNTLTGIVNNKEVNFLMRIQVDKTNIRDAILKYGDYRNVVAFDYYDEIEGLQNLPHTQKPIIYHKDIEGIDINLDMFLNVVPSVIRVALKLPNNYCDMREVMKVSAKYPNVTFCGGNFIRLPGASIGCIKQCDLNKKVSENKVPFVCRGCSCVYENVDLDAIEGAVFSNSTEKFAKVVTKATPSKPVKEATQSKKKKAVSSLAALFSEKMPY